MVPINLKWREIGGRVKLNFKFEFFFYIYNPQIQEFVYNKNTPKHFKYPIFGKASKLNPLKGRGSSHQMQSSKNSPPKTRYKNPPAEAQFRHLEIPDQTSRTYGHRVRHVRPPSDFWIHPRQCSSIRSNSRVFFCFLRLFLPSSRYVFILSDP